MDSITLLALSITTVTILITLGLVASLIADGMGNWLEARAYRNRPRGAARRSRADQMKARRLHKESEHVL